MSKINRRLQFDSCSVMKYVISLRCIQGTLRHKTQCASLSGAHPVLGRIINPTGRPTQTNEQSTKKVQTLIWIFHSRRPQMCDNKSLMKHKTVHTMILSAKLKTPDWAHLGKRVPVWLPALKSRLWLLCMYSSLLPHSHPWFECAFVFFLQVWPYGLWWAPVHRHYLAPSRRPGFRQGNFIHDDC